MKAALVLAPVLFAACSNAKTDVNDDFSAVVDEKSDSFSSRMKTVATLTDPAGSVQFDYTAQPMYRAIKLHALSGDWVKVTVASGEGKTKGGAPPTADPVAFFLDSKFKVVAKNDDANAQTHDSQIVTQLKKSGTFYVVVRDYNYAAVPFNVELQMARVSDDLLADANAWYQFFFFSDYNSLTDRFSAPLSRMPRAAQDDANGFFKTDVGDASGFRIPYGSSVMYFLTGGSDGEAFDARPYDAHGNPIADTAIGGDHGDIVFGPTPPR